MNKKGIMIVGLIAVVAIGLLLFTTGDQSAEQKYEGTTIRVLAWADAHTAAVKKMIPEFEEETGIKVVFDDLPTSSLSEKAAMNLTGKTGTYDLVAIDEPFVPKFAKYLLPYEEWPEPNVAQGKVKLDNLAGPAVQGSTWQDTVVGLPINGNVYMMIYRKDLFNDSANKKAYKEKYGYELQPPKNLDQLKDVSEFFYQPDNELYGWGPFTTVSEGLTVEAMWVLRSFGAEILTDDLKPALDKGKAVEAFEYYKELLKFSPPGKLAYGHPERIQAMNTKNLTIMQQWPAIIPSHEDEEESLVAGKVGYMKNPAGPAGPAAVTGVWALGMPEVSEKKEAAAEFAYWWASKEAGQKLVEKGMSPVRKDLLKDEDLQEKYPWYQAQLENFEIGVNRPRFPEYSELSEIIRKYFAKAINEEMTSEEAVDAMDIEIKELLAENGYIK